MECLTNTSAKLARAGGLDTVVVAFAMKIRSFGVFPHFLANPQKHGLRENFRDF